MSLAETVAGVAERGGNVYDKYSSPHPIERRLVTSFIGQLEELVERSGARETHEVGCGEGELALRLAAKGLRVRGSDAFAEVIAEARRGGRGRLRGEADRGAGSGSRWGRTDRLLRGTRAPRGS
jgi:2-polyprenyl-3-methyl-5-hydroxy-6-metoxy-1,4-benzoquinol methylase